MIDRDRLRVWAADNGLCVGERQAERLDRYAELLVEWNRKMNLTAITDPEGILVKHLMDSLTVLRSLPASTGGPLHLIDVGTGAGFPGIPLAVLREDLSLTLLDSLNKRLVFLQAVCGELGLKARRVHARAEEAGRQKEHRERYDAATARAVASLPALCEYCLPLVKPGGVFLAMKGPEGEREAAEAAGAINALGGRLTGTDSWRLPPVEGQEAERKILQIKKISATPDRFPRQAVKIAKQPL